MIAAAAAGSLGFLAAGYKTPQAVIAEIAEVRAVTERFGVNVFAPHPLPVDLTAFRQYSALIAPDLARYGVTVAADPVEDDDYWTDKIDVLLGDPVPIVSFTFGLPPPPIVDALRRAGTVVVQTVTAIDEARAAAELGVDVLAVQAAAAGGHSGTLHPMRSLAGTPLVDLVAEVTGTVPLPVLAAGGLATPEQIAEVMKSGPAGAVVGTALLRTHEAGTSPVHRAALADNSRESVMTRVFTGRPARGLRNAFIDAYEALAPYGYPALHHLTSPMRKAATAAGDAEHVNLWAGTGFRLATDAPAGDVLMQLVSDL